MKKIYVCIKHVPDSAATIAIQDANRIDENVTFLVNPYDEHALTEAVRIKHAAGDTQVIAVCFGKAPAQNSLRSAMAMGADRAVLIVGDGDSDSIFTARVLAAAIESLGRPWLIFTGKESIDSEGMQTHFRLAHNLKMPVVTNAVKVQAASDSVRVTCERDDGTADVIGMPTPCVIGAGKGLNTPGYPTFPDIVKARKKEIEVVNTADLAIETPGAGTRIVELAPAAQARRSEELRGDAAQIAARIVDILENEAKVL